MTDKTAAELVSDFVKTEKKYKKPQDIEYKQALSKTLKAIKQEMHEWHEENITHRT